MPTVPVVRPAHRAGAGVFASAGEVFQGHCRQCPGDPGPFPLLVFCAALAARLFARPSRRQPVNGILLDVPGFAPFFTAVTRWSIAGEVLLTHRVEYVVLDDVFDAVSDFPSLWLQLDSTEGQWSDRTPEFVRSPYPARLETPAMKFDYPLDLLERVRGRGLGMQNTKIFRLPTIEPGRLMGRGRAIQRRLPAPETAIKIDREQVNYMR
ncbi:TPA: DUF6012 family protein [Pseudomonas aeruginosa]